MLGVLATLALATNLVKSSPLKWIVALIALTGLYSSILRHCTPYTIFGISTAEKTKAMVTYDKEIMRFVGKDSTGKIIKETRRIYDF